MSPQTKFMKKIGVTFLGIAAGTSLLVYYYWNQATALPEWYTASEKLNKTQANRSQNQKSKAVGTQAEKARAAKQSLEKKVEASLRESNQAGNQHTSDRKSVQVKLNEGDINNIVSSEVSKNAENTKLLKAVKGSNTTIKSGKVESGFVANLSDVPVNELPAGEKSVLEKLTKAFPHLKDQEVYIGIVGQPEVENHKIKFDDNTLIRVGNLRFPLSELAKRLDIPKADLERSISFELGKLKVNHVEFTGDSALLKGSVNEKL